MAYIGLVKRYAKTFSIKTIWHDLFDKRDPNEFRENGSQIYHGYQGQGKTLSMVYHGRRLKAMYPKLLIVCNIWLRDWEPVEVRNEAELAKLLASKDFQEGVWQQTHYLRYRSHENLLMLLRHARNAGRDRDDNPGAWGTHFMIDEIHQYFHSHDSKSMPIWVVQVFSQQRKQFTLITGSVQIWMDVIKVIRDQIQNLILCERVGFLIRQHVVDPREFESNYGEREAPIKKTGWFFMRADVRSSYDTRELVQSGREIFGGNEMNIKTTVKMDSQNKR